MSQQAYALAPKIFEANRWEAHSLPCVAVHPEVSFRVLLNHPASASKKTRAGMRERHDALRQAGIQLEGLGQVGEIAAVDYVLDVAVSAWSAQSLCRGPGISLPEPPEDHPESGRPVPSGQIMNAIGPGTRLLDVGTGTGIVPAAAHQRGAPVTGIDFSDTMLTEVGLARHS